MKTITEPRFLAFTSYFESHLKVIPTISRPPGMFSSCLPWLSSSPSSPAATTKEGNFLDEIAKIIKEFLPQALPSISQTASVPDEESALLAPTSSTSTTSSVWTAQKSKDAAGFLLALAWVCKEYSEKLATDSSKTRRSELRCWVWGIFDIVRKDDVMPDDKDGYPAESVVQPYEIRLLKKLDSKRFEKAYRVKFKPVMPAATTSRHGAPARFDFSVLGNDSEAPSNEGRGYQALEMTNFGTGSGSTTKPRR